MSLTGEIMKSWSEIDDQTVKRLIGSMKNRCIKVIDAKEVKTKYQMMVFVILFLFSLLFNGKIIK